MPHRIIPRWISSHWQVKLLCILLAGVLWIALKERVAPGTVDSLMQWLQR
jgi:hypothetical protein